MSLLADVTTASSDIQIDRASLQSSIRSAAANNFLRSSSDLDQVLARTHFRTAGPYNNFIKRALDIILSSLLLLVLTPCLIAIALVISLDGGPAFFRHARVGKHLRPFDCLKFRSMMPGSEDMLEEYLSYNAEDAMLWRRERKLSFDPRVTAIGKVLRKTSLDELPQLLNVLRGDMSLVGPRPVTRDEVVHYGAFIASYASVRPGMTGLWQVSGRSEMSYDARVVLDRCYASVQGVFMDVAILLRTPAAVLSRRGAR